jgi:hypothetical protein
VTTMATWAAVDPWPWEGTEVVGARPAAALGAGASLCCSEEG